MKIVENQLTKIIQSNLMYNISIHVYVNIKNKKCSKTLILWCPLVAEKSGRGMGTYIKSAL